MYEGLLDYRQYVETTTILKIPIWVAYVPALVVARAAGGGGAGLGARDALRRVAADAAEGRSRGP